MKKVISFALVLMLVLSMIGMVAATETPSNASTPTGSITINGASEANTYAIYKMLDLESYDKATTAYSYKVTDEWRGFFTEGTGALAYMTVDNQGYMTWVGGDSDDATKAFAKLAITYAKANSITPLKSTDNEGDATLTEGVLVFSNLPLGYYLVDSTMGALCGLTTTNPDASLQAKNAAPTIEKKVDKGDQWVDANNASVGDTVDYRVSVTVHAGAQNYILHDTMTEGLTFDRDSVKVTLNGTTVNATYEVTENDQTVTKTNSTVNDNTEGFTDGCTFELAFSQDFCDSLKSNDSLMIYYSATLNENAVIHGTGETDHNENTAKLQFGDSHKLHYTTESKTDTHTYAFDIIKTDSQDKLIDGAAFLVYDAATGGNLIPVVYDEDTNTYRRATEAEITEGASDEIVIDVENGKARVEGFGNGTYYLEEVKTPAGYNQLSGRQAFTISDGNLDATFNAGVYSTGSGVQVVNKTGSMLPQTGAMGTAMFITFGMIVVLATGLLLVTKKRMSMIQE